MSVQPGTPAAEEEQEPDEESPESPSLSDRWRQRTPLTDRISNWYAQEPPSRTPRQAKAHTVAGGLLGLVFYAMFINGIRTGPAGVTGWLKAKFLNQPMQGPSAVPANQPTKTPAGPVSV
jgi:hypothetical protein